jgi:subtilase family serine protease
MPSSGTVTIVSDDVVPDLTVSSIVVPAQGAAGTVIQVTDTTNNLGSGAAPASTSTFYLPATRCWRRSTRWSQHENSSGA